CDRICGTGLILTSTSRMSKFSSVMNDTVPLMLMPSPPFAIISSPVGRLFLVALSIPFAGCATTGVDPSGAGGLTFEERCGAAKCRQVLLLRFPGANRPLQ